MGERVVRERPVRRDVAVDDLGHRIGNDEIDPLERGDDRRFGGTERRLGSMNDYTRFRIGRALKWTIVLFVMMPYDPSVN